MKQLIKFLLELGPLIIFFTIYKFYGIFYATGVFMVISILSLIISKVMLGKISQMQLFTTVIIVGLGSITLYMQDPRFVYIKPTIVYLLFASLLLGGLYYKKIFLKTVFEGALDLEDKGWRILTIRWGIFFLTMAVLNEIIWRNFTESEWVTFKTFGFLPLTIIFAISLAATMQKYQITDDNT